MTRQEYKQKKRECWEDFWKFFQDKGNAPNLDIQAIMFNTFMLAFDRAYSLGKQEDADTVISGWVARDKEGDIFMYEHQPKRIYDGEYSRWEEDVVCTQPLPCELFPDLTWDSEPQEVEIIIKRKKNGY